MKNKELLKEDVGYGIYVNKQIPVDVSLSKYHALTLRGLVQVEIDNLLKEPGRASYICVLQEIQDELINATCSAKDADEIVFTDDKINRIISKNKKNA